MMKRIIALLLALILTVGLLPTVALAAEGDAGAATTSVDVKKGYYDNGTWTAGDLTQTLPNGVKSINKTATKTGDNTYEVTLEVVLQQTEENSGKAATVLVLDTSGSMAYCAECGVEGDCVHNYAKFDGTPNSKWQYYYKTTGKNGKETFEHAYYCDGNHMISSQKHNAGWFNSDKARNHTNKNRLTADNIYVKTTRTSRLDAAKVAAENFLKTYSGLTFKTDGTPAANQNSRNLGRYVSVVSFADKAKPVQSWVDVSNSDVYQGVLKNIKGLSAEGGTNLDAGLTYAEYLLNDKDVNGAVKNVIALTDGQPTYCLKKNCNDIWHLLGTKLTIGSTEYCVHGNGKQCTDEIYNSTVATATRVKNVPSKLYTVCFDAGETIDVPNSKNQISVSEYLSTKIATQPTKTGEQFAYDADNAEKLYAEFAKITQSIVSGLNTGTVRDTLPTGITSTAFETASVEWDLVKDFHPESVTKQEGEKQVTTYTYTKTYTVTIDPKAVETVKVDGVDYAPLNGETTLTVGSGADAKEIPFPIPAGKVTMPSYTVTYTDGVDSEVVFENVEKTAAYKAAIPAYGDSNPTRTGYTFTSWKWYNATDTTYANEITPAPTTMPANNLVAVAQWTPATDTKYIVEHYLQNLTGDGYMEPETETKAGTTGTTATATPKTYPGFTCDESVEGTIKSGTIAANGSLVLKLYYTRNSYTVTYTDGVDGAEVFADDEHNNVAYGSTIPAFKDGTPTRAGYNFNGWTSSVEGVTPSSAMPASNVTFTAQWTEKDKVTINYVAQTGGTVTRASETLNPDTGVAVGSTATASTGYRFVGWYDNSECSGTALSTEAEYIPTKPKAGWAEKFYYAKFESLTYTITFETETGGTLTGQTNHTNLAHGTSFPAVPKETANPGYYFDGWYKGNTKVTDFPATVTENATYTAKWLPYSSIGLDLTGKIQKTLNSDVALSNERFTINLTLEGAEAASATATATVSAIASGTGYTGTAPFQTASDEFKLTFTAPDTYKYYIAEEDGLRAGMTYDVNKPANGHQLVVVVQENASNHALFFESVTIDGTEVNPSDVNDTTPWLTITNNYVEPKETFDLNTLITKKFEAAADSKTIPTGTYEFKAQIVETDSGWNKIDSGATYEGTATLTAGGTADFAFGNDRYLKLAAGDHYYLVSEISDTVSGTTGTISYDNLTYSLKITVGPNGKVTYVEVKNFAVVSSFAAENAVEFKEEDHITFNNTYFEEKDPNECTIDFSKFVKKELTTTGSKTVDEATFIVDVAGSYDGEAIANALTPVETQATTDEDVLNTTLTATIKNIVGGNVYEAPFAGSVTVSKSGHYTFTLTERKGTQAGVTYDETRYQVFVNIDRIGDNLVIRDATTYLNNAQVELIKLENDTPVTAGYITFHNTIDTGKDDYYPIIIPTIINKDTGMLNKTDHFAYVIGYPDGTVHPNGQITRAEVATIFFRLLRDEVRDGAFTTSNSYSDVAYGKWYNNPISTMSALGIITGYPDGTFKPNKPITRAEFAAIAARFDETQSGKSATFSDVIGHWAAKEIGIAYYNDWIKGYPDGTFKPDQNITRAEAMTLINRVLERKPESPADLLTNMNKWTDNMDTSKWYYLDVQEATNSHAYTRKTFNYELWRQMLPDPDWSRYER